MVAASVDHSRLYPSRTSFASLITAIGNQNGFVSETREIQLHRKSEIDFVSETGGIRGLHSTQLCRSGLDGVRSTQNSKTRMMGIRGGLSRGLVCAEPSGPLTITDQSGGNSPERCRTRTVTFFVRFGVERAPVSKPKIEGSSQNQ